MSKKGLVKIIQFTVTALPRDVPQRHTAINILQILLYVTTPTMPQTDHESNSDPATVTN